METIYLDRTEIPGNIALIFRNAEIIPMGATVYSMSVREKNEEYQRFADEYDIHFIFDDCIPKLDFYTVPQVDIFAVDSNGGYFASIGDAFDMAYPIYYIDKNYSCFLIAENGSCFVENALNWNALKKTYAGVEFFRSKEEAKSKYEFFDGEALQKLRESRL